MTELDLTHLKILASRQLACPINEVNVEAFQTSTVNFGGTVINFSEVLYIETIGINTNSFQTNGSFDFIYQGKLLLHYDKLTSSFSGIVHPRLFVNTISRTNVNDACVFSGYRFSRADQGLYPY
jgi:hypothetical protein